MLSPEVSKPDLRLNSNRGGQCSLRVRRFDSLPATSGLHRTTDINRPARLVRFVPTAEIAPSGVSDSGGALRGIGVVTPLSCASVLCLEGRHLRHVGIEHTDCAFGRRTRIVPDGTLTRDLDFRQVAALNGRIEGERLRLWIEADQRAAHSTITNPDVAGR